MPPAAPRDSTSFEVREALQQLGCPICQLALRSVGRLLQALAYEQVNDPDLRRQLRAGRGLCNSHAYRWLREVHNVLGTAIIYRDVLAAALEDVQPGQSSSAGSRWRPGRARRGAEAGRDGQCPACEAQVEAEARYLDALLGLVASDASVLQDAEGVCRRHALQAARQGGPGAEPLIAHTRRVVEALVAHLDEVIRKADYRFQAEPRSEAERLAPAAAIAWAAGQEGMTSR